MLPENGICFVREILRISSPILIQILEEEHMKPYGVNQLRRMYLDFFESKEHLKMNSFSLVPHNDNSLLIINSGMAPLKPYFTEIGRAHV